MFSGDLFEIFKIAIQWNTYVNLLFQRRSFYWVMLVYLAEYAKREKRKNKEHNLNILMSLWKTFMQKFEMYLSILSILFVK